MLIYATPGDLSTWMSPATLPDNADALLRSASMLVQDATINQYYDVDGTGLPTDATVLQAFNDATCAQALAWTTLGVDPTAGGVAQSKVAAAKSIGTAHITYADSGAAAQARADSLGALVPDAARILHLAGLLSSHVWFFG